MTWLIRFSEALPKARPGIASSARGHVWGDNVYGNKCVNSLPIIALVTITRHILWKPIRAGETEEATVKAVKCRYSVRHK
jgi:hypothetical protein